MGAVGVLAVIGATVGAFAGYRFDSDVGELVPSLAVAGFGLGGLIGLLLLTPFGLWRAWRRRVRRVATPERTELGDGTGLWHTVDPERDAAAAAAAAVPVVIDAPAAEATESERPEKPAPGHSAEAGEALMPQGRPGLAEEPAAEKPGPESEAPPPPAGEEPGWYPDPVRDRDGVGRYWDAWTGHVWRGRTRERTRKARSRR